MMKFLLFLSFVALSACNPTSSTSLNSKVQDDRRSAENTTTEASAVISLYTDVISEGASLGLTGTDIATQVKEFKKQIKKCMKDSRTSTDLQVLFDSANKCATDAAIAAGLEGTPAMQAKFCSVALVYGGYPADKTESLVSGCTKSDHLPSGKFGDFLDTLVPLLPTSYNGKLASLAVASGDALKIPPAEALVVFAERLPNGDDDFLVEVMTGTNLVLAQLQIPDDEVGNLRTAFQASDSYKKSAIKMSSLVSQLGVSSQMILDAAAGDTSDGGLLAAIAKTVASAVAAATGSETETPASTPASETTTPAPAPAPAPTPFSTNFDLASPGQFTCDGAVPCSSSTTITFSGGDASANTIDLNINSAGEWNAAGADFDLITVVGDTITIDENADLPGLDASWASEWDDLIFYYDFEGAAANIPNTRNSGTYDGTLAADATRTATAKAGSKALVFDGTGDYLETSYHIDTRDDKELTMMMWFKTTDSGTRQYLAGSGSGGGSADWFELYVDSGGSGGLRSYMRSSSGDDDVTSGSGLDDNNWHHVAVVFEVDGANDTMRLYIDGQLADSESLASYADWDFSVAGHSLYVGGLNDQGSLYNDEFTGEIDEFALWHTALTAAEILAIYEKQSAATTAVYTSEVFDLGTSLAPGTISWTTPLPFGKALTGSAGSETSAVYSDIDSDLSNGLLAYYNFDGDIGSGLVDRSGNGQNSTSIEGTVTSGHTGIIGKAMQFGSGHAELGDIDTGGQMSVSIWIYPDADYDAGNNNSIISEGTDDEWDLQFTSDGGGGKRVRFSFHNGSGWQFGTGASETTEPIPQSKWTNIIAIRDSTQGGNDYLIYINGKLDVSSSWRDGDTIRDEVPGVLTIGGWDDNSRRFEGLIDEVAIWDRALTPAEALEVYRRGVNKVEVQTRTCSDATCTTTVTDWFGPDGSSSTSFTEWHNNSTIASNVPTGLARTTQPFNLLSQFTAPSAGQYWQFKVTLETLDEGEACSGSNCLPVVESFSLNNRVGDAVGGAEVLNYQPGYFVNTTAISFASLSSVVISDSGTVSYQLSFDGGSTFYYHTGGSWTVVGSNADAIASNHAALATMTGLPSGTGQLVIKAIMGSAGVVNSVQVNGTN